MGDLVLELISISKNYGALRPLRIERLEIGRGDQVAIVGLDRPAAEVLINLITGASVPDAGEVRAFGRSTAQIASSDEWLASLDRFGIVSERAALLEGLSVLQNLALPFSLEIEPPSDEVLVQAEALAREVRIDPGAYGRRTGELDAAARLRVRLGRALAFGPSLLLLEHPSAPLAPREIREVARDVRAVAERRRTAALTLTADREFASAVAATVLTLDPATGRLKRR